MWRDVLGECKKVWKDVSDECEGEVLGECGGVG